MTYQNKCKVDMRWLKAYHFNRKAITDFNWDYLEFLQALVMELILSDPLFESGIWSKSWTHTDVVCRCSKLSVSHPEENQVVIQEGGVECVYWSNRTQPNFNNKVRKAGKNIFLLCARHTMSHQYDMHV